MDIRVDTLQPGKVVISLPYRDVEKIEAEKIQCPDAMEDTERHSRTIRVTTTEGEVIELELDTEDGYDDNLEIQEVEELPPVKKPKHRNLDVGWLKPKVYKG